jgi:hypothetical protein
MPPPPPSWETLRQRLPTLTCRTIQGVVVFDVARDDGEEGAPTGEYTFWHDVGRNLWRIEDEHGPTLIAGSVWTYQREVGRGFQRTPSQEHGPTSSAGADPLSLLAGPWARATRFLEHGFSIPRGPITVSTVARRPCWQILLAPPGREQHEMIVDIDQATNAVLSERIPDAGFTVAAIEVTIDAPIPDSMYEWDGPFSTSDWDEYLDLEAGQEWLGNNAVPVPQWWPTVPRPRWDGMSADARTRAFQASLDDENHEAHIARWPLDGQPLPYWLGRIDGCHSYRWQRGPWQWELAADAELSADDFARVIASIPDDE